MISTSPGTLHKPTLPKSPFVHLQQQQQQQQQQPARSPTALSGNSVTPLSNLRSGDGVKPALVTPLTAPVLSVSYNQHQIQPQQQSLPDTTTLSLKTSRSNVAMNFTEHNNSNGTDLPQPLSISNQSLRLNADSASNLSLVSSYNDRSAGKKVRLHDY
jgi:hypothetical protein